MASPAAVLRPQISSHSHTPFMSDNVSDPNIGQSTMPNNRFGPVLASPPPIATPFPSKPTLTEPPPDPCRDRTDSPMSRIVPLTGNATDAEKLKDIAQNDAQVDIKEPEEPVDKSPPPDLPRPAVDLGLPAPGIAFAAEGPFGTLIKETVELRDKVVTRRIGLEISEGDYNSQWKHTTNHLHNFMAAASGFMDTIAKHLPPTMKNQVEDSYDQLQTSAQHLMKWQTEGKSQGKDLTKWEGRLQTKEEELYLYLRRIIQNAVVSDYTASEGGYTMNWERLSDSTANTDPIEHDYYNKIGDVNLIREHVFNFDADHQRRMLQREWAMKTGEFVVIQNERDIYLQYVRERKSLIQEYIDAKQEMERLRTMCIKKGLEVEDPDLPPFLDLSQRVERPPMPLVRHRETAFRMTGRFDPDIYLRFGGLDNKTRILRWRDNVRRALSGEQEEIRSKSPAKKRLPQKDTTSAPPESLKLKEPEPSLKLLHQPPAQMQASSTSEELDLDEDLPRFDMIQGDAPTRRYSEPSISITLPGFLRELGIKNYSFQEKHTAKSETELDACVLPSQTGHQAEFVIDPPSSELRRLKHCEQSV